MPDVTVDTLVTGTSAAAVFDRLRDFAAYPRHTDAVREVIVTGAEGDTVSSRWSVNFRNGVLCWAEDDRIDAERLTIDFAQTDGDFERFEGSWRVRQDEGCVAVRFAASFDLGMPSLAAIIDPVAVRALTEAITLILRGLLGEHLNPTTVS